MRIFLVSAWTTPVNAMLATIGSREVRAVVIFMRCFLLNLEPFFAGGTRPDT
jgi:hypothetical protein